MKNGIIIGAVVGGVAMAAVGAYICGIFGEGNCVADVLRVTAIGAGAGAAAGAGLDAMLERSRHRQQDPGVERRSLVGIRVRF